MKLKQITVLLVTGYPLVTQPRPALDKREDFESVAYRLQHEAIVSITPFRKTGGAQATHPIRLITLESGLQGLFKTGEYQYAEVAAYRLSKELNIFLVPPTIFRIIDGQQGSLQLYIDAQDLTSIPGGAKMLNKVSQKAVSDMKVFYYLAGQWDTHHGNQLLEKEHNTYRIWLIDNSGILHRSYSIYKGATFIEKGTNAQVPSDNSATFPFHKARTIEGGHALDIFRPYIPSSKHRERLSLKDTLTYITWKDTLWLLYETEGHSRISRHTTSYCHTTLEALKTLSYENLLQVWAEWLMIDPSSGNELITLILDRRDELLKASLLGSLIPD